MPSTSAALAAVIVGGLSGLILLSIALGCAILQKNLVDRAFYGTLFSILGLGMLALAATGGSWLNGNLNRSHPALDLPVDRFDIVLVTEADVEFNRVCVDVYKSHRTGCAEGKRPIFFLHDPSSGKLTTTFPDVGSFYYLERMPSGEEYDHFLFTPVPREQLY